jgi:TrmH family RNA methyltransferase
MLTKNKLKYYASLKQKKFRDKENKFIVEGKKTVFEGIHSNHKCDIIFVNSRFNEENRNDISFLSEKGYKIELLKNPDFIRISDAITPQGIAAVFNKPANTKKNIELITSKIVVCLENISDPGNLGTMIRNCDWFGIKEVFLLNNCADIYNPKTIRASMGSIFHSKIFEDISEKDLETLKKRGYKILCADLTGKNIFDYKPPDNYVIIFSNEASGPSEKIISLSDERITIPKIGNAESLNVASASAVILAKFTFNI